MKKNIKDLERRLRLIRTDVQQLAPAQLQEVQGGNGLALRKEGPTGCGPYTRC